MNVTVWNEHVAEREKPEADRIYPGGMHATLAAALADVGTVRTATLAERDHGLPPEVLDSTDVLHSGHFSKPFKRLMGTRCTLRWRHDERETVWTVAPGHPIAAGVPECFVIPEQEMYGEFFDVPPPDELVFISSFAGGEVFRSGCCWTRGRGRIFYFSPGHETHPVYHQPEVQRVLVNAVRWAQPLP